MEAVVLVIHLMLALALIAVILVQQSEGGGLGIGGGGGGMGGLATARGTANLLTRTTTILATCFLITSLGLALIAKDKAAVNETSILEMADEAEVTVPLAREDAAGAAETDRETLKDSETSESAGDVEQVPAVPISE